MYFEVKQKKKSNKRISYISAFTFLSDISVYAFVKYPQVKLTVDTQTHIHKLNNSIIKMLFSSMILQSFVPFYGNLSLFKKNLSIKQVSLIRMNQTQIPNERGFSENNHFELWNYIDSYTFTVEYIFLSLYTMKYKFYDKSRTIKTMSFGSSFIICGHCYIQILGNPLLLLLIIPYF